LAQEVAAAVLEPLVRKPAAEQEMCEWEQLLERGLINKKNFSY
jgi:hypothetical protein